jgi:hypothetical protein
MAPGESMLQLRVSLAKIAARMIGRALLVEAGIVNSLVYRHLGNLI